MNYFFVELVYFQNIYNAKAMQFALAWKTNIMEFFAFDLVKGQRWYSCFFASNLMKLCCSQSIFWKSLLCS